MCKNDTDRISFVRTKLTIYILLYYNVIKVTELQKYNQMT